ncbi:MAG: hypothetical protein E6R13_08330 [Spirochaetes bacterium]|nr:MAG: hypothetical protein E6R13_08330 [Spirochaetota bacterium]
MSDHKKLGVALAKELCPVCTKQMDGPILMNTRLTPGEADKVEKFHGQLIGWSKELCPECKEMKEKGFILIGAVEKKTTDVTNPYRSGNIWVVAHSVATNLFGENPPKSGIAFIDVTVAHQMGLPNVNLNA